LQGIKPANISFTQIKEKLIEKLKLSFAPDEWQLHLILRIRQGYDSIFCAGTGYGKSLIFEGLVALGGKGRVVIVISPLKALERDQVRVFTSRSVIYANIIVLLGCTSLKERHQRHHDQRG
jgi:superfamily II DNA helicase RecQ